MSNEAFVYRWRRDDGRWYVGYHKGTPDDGYICSSIYAKPDIEQYPERWTRKILRYGTKKQMMALEIKMLKKLNARDNPNSFNRSNGYPPYDVARAIARRPEIQIKVTGTRNKVAVIWPEFNKELKKISGHSFEYHYLTNFFSVIKEKNAAEIKHMIPGISALFGIELELHYV